MTRVAVTGAGRMGQSILRLAAQYEAIEVVSVWVRGPGSLDVETPSQVLVSDDLDKVVAAAEVVIDFSLPGATDAVLAAVTAAGKPLVSGVTGHSDDQHDAIRRAAETIPLLHDRNMSQGVAALEQLVERAGRVLGPEFTVAIREIHHVHKKDAPSGTALKLGEAVARSGRVSSTHEIPIESERQGEVPGVHSVVFASDSERLELTHSVTTRDVFAAGALHAAAWIVGRRPGLYTMHDVLSAE